MVGMCLVLVLPIARALLLLMLRKLKVFIEYFKILLKTLEKIFQCYDYDGNITKSLLIISIIVFVTIMNVFHKTVL